jgi:putative oxidoreductase
MQTNNDKGAHMSVGERDFASLALRATIGPMLIAHGTNKVFGSGGLEGTTRWFEALGLRPAAVHARMAAAT